MSIWRSLAIAVLVSCSGAAAPKPPPVSASAPGGAEAATAVVNEAAGPAGSPSAATDPVCGKLADADPGGGDATAGDPGATDPGATDDAAAGDEGDSSGRRRRKLERISACSVARVNFARDAEAILAAHGRTGKPAPRTPWDHRTRPERLDQVRRRFELAPDELAQLGRTGVVVPARLTQPSYAYAYHEIFQSQLPVYITADSVFHAIFASHDAIVEKLERASLAPALGEALDRMHCALAAATDYPADTVRDLDLYLTVARTLAGHGEVHSIRGDAAVDAAASDLVTRIRAAAGAERVALFGRDRLVDFTAYTPRGHYASSEDLTSYFLAAMWTSRIEFNLVSRSSRSSAPGPEPDPSETPREAIDALALADLAETSGAAARIDLVDRAWNLLAGRREDVSIGQLAQLRRTAGIASLQAPAAFGQLKAAIGDRFQRTTRLHPMPEGSTVLPAIATLIGPRVVPDAHALMPVVNSAVPGRNTVHAADVVYSLGLDRARRYLAADLAAFPALDGQLAIARTIAQSTQLGDDLYSAWYAAIRALAVTPAGALPSFLTGDAGADLRFNTMTAAYGQLKHNYVLMAGQPYSEFGCEIPDGYVEPVPAAYDALIEYATRLGKVAALVDPGDHAGAAAHAARVIGTLRVLRAIAGDELANRPLTTAEKHWLGMVTELSVDTSQDITGYPPVYSGWYFDLFLEAEGDGMRGAGFIADYFTSVEDGISYAGATAPRLGIFVVDTGGAPRAFVGPVARAYEAHTPLAARLTDETAGELAKVDEPWAASYTIADSGTAPALALRYDRETGDVTVKADHAIGPATIKLLDHHRLPLATLRQPIQDGETVFAFHRKKQVGAVYVVIGAFRDWVVGDSYGEIYGGWGKLERSDD
ncbi:MAG TPA: DUF3160 domain-containing protein [Kofleriaceae bacterium]|jgi:hypothetical protein|nr:DUF3160 domain-containing protein [Kofleriaceae bacterium]